MPDSFYLRRAVESDASAIMEIVHESMEYYKQESGIKGDVLESLSESVDSVLQRIRTQRCLCIFEHNEAEMNVADGVETSDILLGTITIHEVSNPLKYSFSNRTFELLSQYKSCAYISRFAVTSKARKNGLGVKLIDFALTCPEFQDTGLVILHTAIANRPMKDFYFNRGFELLDSEHSRGYERGLFIKKKVIS